MNQKKFDTRILERNVSRGVLKPEEVEKFGKELPDDAANAEWVSIEEIAASTDGVKKSS